MGELKQTITCPACEGNGYFRRHRPSRSRLRKRWVWLGCPVCNYRGMLIIDEAATAELPRQPRPGRKSR